MKRHSSMHVCIYAKGDDASSMQMEKNSRDLDLRVEISVDVMHIDRILYRNSFVYSNATTTYNNGPQML